MYLYTWILRQTVLAQSTRLDRSYTHTCIPKHTHIHTLMYLHTWILRQTAQANSTPGYICVYIYTHTPINSCIYICEFSGKQHRLNQLVLIDPYMGIHQDLNFRYACMYVCMCICDPYMDIHQCPNFRYVCMHLCIYVCVHVIRTWTYIRT